jgi:glycosyltransferase involved in cell wall biosynthesis
MRILILTYIPSPYQVEFFNAIASSGQFELQVAYLNASCNAPIAQSWQPSNFAHSYLILGDRPENYQQLVQALESNNLVIFNYYRHPQINSLIARCIKLELPWCFWGERPGFKNSGLLGWLYRRWQLAQLHRAKVPIWGVGTWGVKRYRREFGSHRLYVNLPYFSNLSRFAVAPKSSFPSQQRVFLYSGALIKRKGVDLLAAAFCRLAAEFKQIKLILVGEGELRASLTAKLASCAAQVEFCGYQAWENLPNYYQQADILCVPSRYDGWGLVVPEGLAAGLPVISTDRTGAAIDLISHHENGWLIRAGNLEALYQAMRQAVTLAPQELATYSQAASDRALKHSLTVGVQQFTQAINQTVKQSTLIAAPQDENTPCNSLS